MTDATPDEMTRARFALWARQLKAAGHVPFVLLTIPGTFPTAEDCNVMSVLKPADMTNADLALVLMNAAIAMKTAK